MLVSTSVQHSPLRMRRGGSASCSPNNCEAARTLVDDLARQHPGVDTEGRVQMVKRQTIRKLARGPTRRFPTVSQLKRLSPCWRWRSRSCVESNRTPSQSTRRWVDESSRRLTKIANFQTQAGARLPLAFAGLERFARYVQPAVAEFVFHKMSGVKPGQAGAARNAYKGMRSRVWRARHDRGVAEAAAGGASSRIAEGHRRWSSPTHRALRGPILARPKAIAAPLTAAAHSARLNT